MRLYTAAGVDAGRVAQVAAFNAGAFVIGMAAFGAAGLLWGGADVAGLLRVPAWLLQTIAVLAAAGSRRVDRSRRCAVAKCASAIAGRCACRRRILPIRQLLISALDLSASAAALWFLLPPDVVRAAGLLCLVRHGGRARPAESCARRPGRFRGRDPARVRRTCAARRDHRCARSLSHHLLPVAAARSRRCCSPPTSCDPASRRRSRRAAVATSPLLLATLTFIAGALVARLRRHAAVARRDRSARTACAAAAGRGVAFHRQRSGSRDARGRARIAASPGCGLVGSVPARDRRSDTRDAEGDRILRGCIPHGAAFLLLLSRRQFERRSALFSHSAGCAPGSCRSRGSSRPAC